VSKFVGNSKYKSEVLPLDMNSKL